MYLPACIQLVIGKLLWEIGMLEIVFAYPVGMS
jgi:hypothetical protein